MPGSEKYSGETIHTRTDAIVENIGRILADPDSAAPRNSLEQMDFATNTSELVKALKKVSANPAVEQEQYALEELDHIKKRELYLRRIQRLIHLLKDFHLAINDYSNRQANIDLLIGLADEINHDIATLSTVITEYGTSKTTVLRAKNVQSQLHIDTLSLALAQFNESQAVIFNTEWFTSFVYEVIIRDTPTALPIVLLNTITNDDIWDEPTVGEMIENAQRAIPSFLELCKRIWSGISKFNDKNYIA